MALPTNADVIVVHGYWLDELTGVGVKQANGLPATIMFDPVPLLGANAAKTPNLRDLTSNAHLKTRTRVASVDPVTGYYAAQLVASNDPDLDAYSGRKVTFLGEDPFTIEVPYNAPTVTVSAEMAAKTGLTQGSSVKAIWLPNASVTTIPTPTPSVNYLSSSQTLANIAAGIETHDEDPAAHADIRALIGTPYTDEQARDALGAALVAGSNVTITPNDGADTITISATVPSSYSDEQAQDAFAALIAAGTHSGISFAYNDAGNALSATVAAQSWSQITGTPSAARFITPPVTLTASSGTITPDASASSVFRYTATSNVTLAEPINGIDGQRIVVEITASGADRTLSFAGTSATSVVITSGSRWTGQLIYDSGASLWSLNDGTGAALTVRAVSANTTAVAGELLEVDASGAARTITPPASAATGTEVAVVKTDSTSNAVIWSGTVDGDAQGVSLTAQWTAVSFVFDGTQWLVKSTTVSPAQTVLSVNSRTGAVTGLAENSDLTAHTGNTSNPHAVTKAQVGLGSVDNTADTAKPISTAQQTALDAKAAKSANLSDLASATTARTNLGLATVAATGSYADLSSKPTIAAAPTAADSTITVGGTATAPTVAVNAIAESQVTNLTTDLTGKLAKPTTPAATSLVTVDSSGNVGTRTLPDVQTFTASGTWTKPAGATTVRVEMMSGGGGGGSGARLASGTASSGGAGGGGGGLAHMTFRAADLGSTETVTVGAGGTAGPSRTTDSQNGGAGGTGGNSSFGTTTRVRATGATGGAGGSTAASAAGTSGFGMSSGGGGGAGNAGAGGSVGASGTGGGATGGGGGGGVSVTPGAFVGSSGGVSAQLTGSANGGAINTAGAVGVSNPLLSAIGGNGGGGGGSSITGVAGDGGAGGTYGGGGGGGGSSLNGSNSGAGGAGAAGIVIVSSW